jgi:hypothetical protein
LAVVNAARNFDENFQLSKRFIGGTGPGMDDRRVREDTKSVRRVFLD